MAIAECGLRNAEWQAPWGPYKVKVDGWRMSSFPVIVPSRGPPIPHSAFRIPQLSFVIRHSPFLIAFGF
jgi:hypothetical protein